MWSGAGASASTSSVWTVSPIERAWAARAVFPPEEVARVKAIACELPKEHGLPLSRFSRAELHRLVVERGVCEASGSTIARWLSEDALKPWQYRSWIFPQDPDFLAKAGRVLDLCQGRFQGRLLEPGDCVICADEKPSIQARLRQRLEHRYERRGALTYLAALDIKHADVSAGASLAGGSSPSTGSSGR